MQNPKILIVDDETIHQIAIMDIIEENEDDYEILSAFEGRTALEIAKNELPDLIISDWEMPVMDGIEFIKKLKKDRKTADIPVIMCSGIMTSSGNLETALSAGAVDYIRKPIDKIELIARIKANLHLADKYNEVKKLNESKDKIFSVISHDLRGPVGNIQLLSDLVIQNKSQYSQEEILNYVAKIGETSGSTFSILENLLMWARSQRKSIDFAPSEQAINYAIKDNIILLTDTAAKKEITIQNNIADYLTAFYDINLISSVVRNLIANAIKFTPKGGKITINARTEDKFQLVSITDTGVGISAERIAKIFDKTSYETTYGTNNEKGSGVGLKLCIDFVEKNGGKIWVESVEGSGSKFCFTLPANKE